MALSSVSPVVLPYAECSCGTPRQRLFQRREVQYYRAIRKLQFLPSLILHASPYCVRRGGRQKTLFASIIRAGESENSEYDDARVSNEGERSSNYVATRAYRKALASLRVIGEALPIQVNAALAADGGRTAVQELKQGKPMLVIETYNPGQFSEDSTVSTKLQAPTLTVIERAKWMAKKDTQFSPSGRAFAVAFQAVRLLNLSKFELCFFKPGTVKGMSSYEGDIAAILEVSDTSVLSEIAKDVCSYALACVKDNADRRVDVERFGTRLFQNRPKVKLTTVESFAMRISTLSEAEVLAHVEKIVQDKSLLGTSMGLRRHRSWWERPLATESVMKTGVDAHLVDEFVPAHALHFKIPSKNSEALGLQKTIHLTHAQMTDLADVLDLYCGDPYTGSGENVTMRLDIPRRSWTMVAQTFAVGALATAVGGALLLGFLSRRRTWGQMETPTAESVFDMAFSQKLKEMRGTELLDEQTDPVVEQSEAEVVEQTEDVNEQTEDDDGQTDDVYAEQSEAGVEQPIADPVNKSPIRVQFRKRTRYYN